ncbi:MAG: RdgB/HAM1 family non-canonical purine NTP pyrophosphatase, partial [bacterium]|nr:RdgB/HAM1 family non-canonical purine NTP pyrophosphatase [bacterium]
PEETGNTLFENALLKARTYFELTKLPTLSDDSGLFVEILNGEPGVHSARFAGKSVTYTDNRRKLKEIIEDKVDPITAYFATVIAIVTQKGEWTFEGRCNGTILREDRGTNGFGYDPMFVPEGSQRTFAEMTNAEKNLISHRSVAFNLFIKAFTEKQIVF